MNAYRNEYVRWLVVKLQVRDLSKRRKTVVAVTGIALFVVASVALLGRSGAATAYLSTEVETGTYNGSAARVVDAGASGGAAVNFAATTPTSPGDFPRLGGMLIGGGHAYDVTTYQQQIAKLDMAILGMYNTWNRGGKTPAQAVNEIKAYNPRILLGNYTLMTEVNTSATDSATADLRNKLNSSIGPNRVGDWWAYNAAGQKTNWSGGTYPVNDVNLTLQTTPDANGDRWPQWMAKRDNTNVISKANWDIWYSDNNFWKPRISDDWDRNGTNDDANNETVRNLYRNGQRAYYDTAKSLQPTKQLMVNADNDLDGSVFPSEANPFTQYKGVMGGAFLEHAFGESWSAETWGGWSVMMGWYQKTISNLAAPQMLVLDAYMGNNTADYKTLRYAFGSTLLDNGYFSASSDYDKVLWYDEFDLAGKGTTKWLGKAIDGPQTAAWQNGVYKRTFTGGMVLVNPKGSGTKTVTIGAGYHRFAGTQVPSVNTGQPVTSTVTLTDRDALFLVKD
jgi:hypothetical protein